MVRSGGALRLLVKRTRVLNHRPLDVLLSRRQNQIHQWSHQSDRGSCNSLRDKMVDLLLPSGACQTQELTAHLTSTEKVSRNISSVKENLISVWNGSKCQTARLAPPQL